MILISCLSYVAGVFRGAAHNECNINYKDSRTIPVAFHNMSNYDAHIIIKDIAHCAEGPIHIIPENTEKYIAHQKCERQHHQIPLHRHHQIYGVIFGKTGIVSAGLPHLAPPNEAPDRSPNSANYEKGRLSLHCNLLRWHFQPFGLNLVLPSVVKPSGEIAERGKRHPT